MGPRRLLSLAGGGGWGRSGSALRFCGRLVSRSLIGSALIRGSGAAVSIRAPIAGLGRSGGLGSIVRGVETRTLEVRARRGGNQPYHFTLANRALFFVWGR